ncbi:hypothetical protein HDU76_011881, partial [Blyttiomyces sp. JEL0837]
MSEYASTLVSSGYSVTVLYVGATNPNFDALRQKYLSENINLQTLKPLGLTFGDAKKVEQKSYEVYQYLLRSTGKFSHVYFSATSGTAYYTLTAQSQGLLCSKTSYVVAMDTLTRGALEQIESGDAEFYSVNPDTLKLDYMTQKSMELADVAVFSSNILARF